MNSGSQKDDTGRRWARLLVLGMVAVAPLVAGYAFVVSARGAAQEQWLVRALTSELTIRCGLILWASLVSLMVLGSMLWRAGARARAQHGRGQDGAVILEFAMCLPFMLMLVLLLVQSSMLMGGNICVHYAAYCAARSAVVNIPADGGEVEPPNVLESPRVSGKYLRIRSAGLWAVLPVSYGGQDIDEEDTEALSEGLARFFAAYGAHRPGWIGGYLGRKLYYAIENTHVHVVPPADGLEYDQHEDVEVKISHKFYMSVPFVARLFRALGDDDVRDLPFGRGEQAMLIRASCTLTNEGVQSYVEEEMNEDPS